MWCLHVPFRETECSGVLDPATGRLNRKHFWPCLSLSCKTCQFITEAPPPSPNQCNIADAVSSCSTSQPERGLYLEFYTLKDCEEKSSRKCSACPHGALRTREWVPVHTAQDLGPESLICGAAGPRLTALTCFKFSRKGVSRGSNAQTQGEALPCVTLQVKTVFEVGRCVTCLTGLGLLVAGTLENSFSFFTMLSVVPN